MSEETDIDDPRDDAAYEDSDYTEINGLKVRPFSVMTLKNAKRLNLTMCFGDEDLSRDDLIDQVTAYAWMQSAPIRDVIRAIREDRSQEEIDVFEAELSTPTLKLLMGEIERHVRQMADHAIDLMPRDEDAEGEDDEPPNS